MIHAANNFSSRLVGAALLCCASVFVPLGNAIPGPRDRTHVGIEEEAIRDMQWREKIERPRTQAPRRALPVPAQQPAVQKPDLSGLPRELPQAIPTEPQIVNVPSSPSVFRPKLFQPPAGLQPLIKPHVEDTATPERAPRIQQRHSEPERVQPRSTTVRRGPENLVKQTPPAPGKIEASVPGTRPAEPPQRPHVAPDPRTGLIKPRLQDSRPENHRSGRTTSSRQVQPKKEQPRPPAVPPSHQSLTQQQAKPLPTSQPAVQPKASQVPVQPSKPQPLIKPRLQ